MKKGNWLYRTGENCDSCGEDSVDLYENGYEICEHCSWNKTEKRFEYNIDS